MDIDLDATVSYMKPNLVNLKEIRRILGGLEREADFENLDNQKILQEMFQRQAKNKPMLESWDFVPYHGPRRDPYRIFGISKDGTV